MRYLPAPETPRNKGAYVNGFGLGSLVAAGLVCALIVIFFAGQALGQTDDASNEPPAGDGAEAAAPVEQPAGPQTLESVKLGSLPEYSRLIFTFSKPVSQYTVSRNDVDRLVMNFGPAESKGTGILNIEDDVVSGVALSTVNDRLMATVRLKPTRFKFRHFVNPNRTEVVVDLRDETPGGQPILAPDEESGQDLILDIPDPQKSAEQIRLRLPKEPKEGTPHLLLAQAADKMAAGDFQGAIQPLTDLKNKFPQTPLLNIALFMLGDAQYYAGRDKLEENFPRIASAYQEAITSFPKSRDAARASFMRAKAYKEMNYLKEAEGYIKLMVMEYPDSKYTLMAKALLAEIFLDLDRRDEAQSLLEEIMANNPKGNLIRDIYIRLGESFFDDGLFGKSVEVFKYILKEVPDYYVRHPEILYYLGESYFNLNRMELARAYLYHYINLVPESKDADLVMARIGDTYKEDGNEQKAIQIYDQVRKQYPDSVGALVAMMRLADAGALRTLFPPNQIFTELEDGAEGAALKMYLNVANTKDDSPLVQLALFRIGQSYFNLDEHKAAMNAILELLTRFPNSSLADEAKRLLSRAILEEAKNLLFQKKYVEVTALYTAHKKWVDDDTWPEMRHVLAQAYAALGLNKEASKLWEANKDLTDKEPERLMGLGLAYIAQEQFEKAIAAFEELRERFPDHQLVGQSLVEQARALIALGRDEEALKLLEQAHAMGLEEGDRVQMMLGDLYIKRGDFANGVEALKRFIETNTGNKSAAMDLFLAYSKLGQAYLGLGQYGEAEAALDKAMEIKPRNAYGETLYLIANTYKQLRLKDKFTTTLEAMKSVPDPFWQQVADQEIKAMNPNEKVDEILGIEPPEEEALPPGDGPPVEEGAPAAP